MKYSLLTSIRNLELAWRRIVTGRNMQYKRFYRPIYLSYEVAHKENIRKLHNRLIGGWRASPPNRIFLPKASGLQRPLSLMGIEDQIVLQAIANAFAEKLSPRRKEVENEVVFSNILEPEQGSLFFIQDWHQTYDLFQRKCSQHFEDGFRWIAHFDLAAFYDTISHEILIQRVSPRGGNKETWDRVKVWFRVWCSSVNQSLGYHHGIPQGPIASDFLAECLLLPLDEELKKQDIRYVRYVDDIRIFADTRVRAQKAAMILEVFCRNLGLIPQGKKFAIFEASSESQVLGMLPSLAPPDNSAATISIPLIKENDAIKRFRKALDGRPLKIVDKSLAKYILFRAPRSRRLLSMVIPLIDRHPEHIDAFAAYLSNFKKSVPLERKISDILISGIPYQYLRAELWLIISRIASVTTCQNLIGLAKQELRDKTNSPHLNWGILAFLLKCQHYGLGRFIRRICSQDPWTKALMVPIIPEVEYSELGVVKDLLLDDDFLPSIVLAEQLIRRNQTHLDYRIRIRQLPPETQNVFRQLGMIKRRTNVEIDQVQELLSHRYGIAEIRRWRDLLAGEYPHAMQILLQADAIFHAGRSNWLSQQNSFNDILTRSFIGFLNQRNLAGARSLVRRDG